MVKMTANDLSIISNPEFQNFLRSNYQKSSYDFVLNPPSGLKFPVRLMAEQMKCYPKVAQKCPSLLGKNLVFLSSSFEQSSGESAARFKKTFMQGDRLLDLSCGLGIDALFLAECFKAVDVCEINPDVLSVAKHNFNVLGFNHIKCHLQDGVEFLEKVPDGCYDWIYVDPSRRVPGKRVFDLAQSSPNITTLESVLLQKAKKVCIKASPLMDLTKCKKQFSSITALIVVSVDGECKEVLLILDRNAHWQTSVTSAVVLDTKHTSTGYRIDERAKISAQKITEIKQYVYDPDPAIVKAGLRDQLAKEFGLHLFNPAINLLTSQEKMDAFPGRIFEVEAVITFNKKLLHRYFRDHQIKEASVMKRNFPFSSDQLRAMFKLKESRKKVICFTTLAGGKKVCLIGTRIFTKLNSCK